MTKRSADHPPLFCAVEGCKSKTRRIAPLAEGRYDLETGGAHEWLCSRHWRRVPRTIKRRRSLFWRRWIKLADKLGTSSYWTLPPGSPARSELVRLERIIRRVWARCKTVAAGEDSPIAGDLPAGLSEELRRAGL